MSNLEIAYAKIVASGLNAEEQKRVKLEASKNAGIAEGIKLEDPITDDFLRGYLGKNFLVAVVIPFWISVIFTELMYFVLLFQNLYSTSFAHHTVCSSFPLDWNILNWLIIYYFFSSCLIFFTAPPGKLIFFSMFWIVPGESFVWQCELILCWCSRPLCCDFKHHQSNCIHSVFSYLFLPHFILFPFLFPSTCLPPQTWLLTPGEDLSFPCFIISQQIVSYPIFPI